MSDSEISNDMRQYRTFSAALQIDISGYIILNGDQYLEQWLSKGFKLTFRSIISILPIIILINY